MEAPADRFYREKQIPTKSEIMDLHWLEFLSWVKKHNQNAADSGSAWAERDASEINFWHWYIDNKLGKA